MGSSDSPNRFAGPWALAASSLVCLVFFVFYPALSFPFVSLDTPIQVVDNPDIRGLTAQNLWKIFTTRGVTTSYYPIRSLTYAIDYQLFELNPLGYKLTNVVFHLTNVLLVQALIFRLLLAGKATHGNVWSPIAIATCGASIFAVHPVVVEPAVWVPGREELLMALGALGCIHLHLSFRQLEQRGGSTLALTTCLLGSGLFCLVACLSNAVAAVIPMLVLAWDLTQVPRVAWRRILTTSIVLWMIAAGTIIAKRARADQEHGGQRIDLQRAELIESEVDELEVEGDYRLPEFGVLTPQRLELVANVFWLNTRAIVWPAELAISYAPVVTSGFGTPEVVMGLAAGVVVLALIWLLRQRSPTAFGLVWFVLALGPTGQVIPHHLHRADRFLYLPLIGIVLAIATIPAWNRSRSVRITLGLVGLLLFSAYAPRAMRQVNTWQDTVAMWEQSIRCDSGNIVAYRNLGIELAQMGEFPRAFAMFQQALDLNPFNIQVLNEYASWLVVCDDRSARDYDKAIAMAEYACTLTKSRDPQSLRVLAQVYNETAINLSAAGQQRGAIEFFQKARATDPSWTFPTLNLASLLASSNSGVSDPNQAVQLASEALQKIGNPSASQLMILANCYDAAGRQPEAAQTLARAIEAAEQAGDVQRAELLRRQLGEYRQQPGTR